MNDTFSKIVTGGAGVATSEIVGVVDIPTATDTADVVKVVVQLIIGIATLLGLFKKKSK